MSAVVFVLGAGVLVGCLYLIAAVADTRRFLRLPAARTPVRLPVTILKPLYGEDRHLYECLRSFCLQDYPRYQIIFGVRDAADAAVPVVHRLIAEFPELPLELVVDARTSGTNLKVSNLENMMAVARHDVLVIADSDMIVGQDYLAAVTAPLLLHQNGLVTCLYRGRPTNGVWSRLAASFVNHGFLPSAVIAERLRPGDACFGATIALRRDTYEAIGGFASLRDHLADDYALGAAVRRTGRKIVLSTYLVDTVTADQSFGALFSHELRWSRTIRLLAPAGYAASIVTQPVALALIALCVSGGSGIGFALCFLAFACRLATVRILDRVLQLPKKTPPWMVPLRDLLSFVVFVASFCGNRVAWRGRTFRIAADGRLVAPGDTGA